MHAKKKGLKRIIIIFILLTLLIVAVRFFNIIKISKFTIELDNETKESMYPLELESMLIEKIDYGKAQGFHMIPDNKCSDGIIITFGGSEGSCLYDLGKFICGEGYEVICLYYFAKNNLNSEMKRVDINFFDDVIKHMNKNKIDYSNLTIVGFSKGTELSLLLSQYYSETDNIVLYSPSAYSYQGEGYNSQMWLYNDEEIPFLSYSKSDKTILVGILLKNLFKKPISYRNLHQSISEEKSENSSEWIYKKKFNGEILIFAGDSDLAWPSDRDGKRLKEYDSRIELHLFEGAGHIFSEFMYLDGMTLGGNKKGNLNAKKQSDALLLEKLRYWHKELQ